METKEKSINEVVEVVQICTICESREHLTNECLSIPMVKEIIGEQAITIEMSVGMNDNPPFSNTYNPS